MMIRSPHTCRTRQHLSRSAAVGRIGLRKLALYVTFLLLLVSGQELFAQSLNPVLAKRQKLVDMLNAALTSHSTGISGDCSDIMVVDENGACNSLEPSRIHIQYFTNPSRFALTIMTEHAGTATVDGTPSLLVSDLNSYLASLGMEIQNLSPISGNLSDLFTCGVSGPFNRYFSRTVTDASWWGAVRTAQGVDRIKNTTYNINGQYKKGSDFLTFERTGTGNTFRYLGDRNPSGGGAYGSFATAKLSSVYLAITQQVSADTTIRFEIDANLWTRAYPSNAVACEATYSGPRTTPFFEAMFVTTTTASGVPHSDTSWCYDSFRGTGTSTTAQIDSENAVLFGFGMPGTFSVDVEGRLKYAGLPSFCAVTTFKPIKITDTQIQADSCYEEFCLPGAFVVDQYSGEIYYQASQPSTCGVDAQTPDLCIQFCDTIGLRYREKLSNVVSATAVQYADAWSYDTTGLGAAFPGSNDYETAVRGEWRPSAHYAYRSAIQGGAAISSNPAERIHANAGTFDFVLYNYRWPSGNDATKWLRSDTVVKYSPNGLPVEDADILGIPSAMKLGYGQQLTVAAAKNARYGRISFDSFEDSIAYSRVTMAHVHSGKRSLFISKSGATNGPLTNLASVSALPSGVDSSERKMVAKFWVKRSMPLSDIYYPVMVRFGSGSPDPLVTPEFIARSGDWSLYQVTCTSSSSVRLTIERHDSASLTSDDTVWVDDVRIQPIEAQMAASVYDQDAFRLVANFDDNHFGVYYQYNGEGRLVRKMRETERGMKTIEETQYNRPSIARGSGGGSGGITSGISPSSSIRRSSGQSYSVNPVMPPDSGAGAGMKADLLNVTVDTSGVSYGAPVVDSVRAVSLRISKAIEMLKQLSADSTSLGLLGQLRDARERFLAMDASAADSATQAGKAELRERIESIAREIEGRTGLSREMLRDLIDAYDSMDINQATETGKEDER